MYSVDYTKTVMFKDKTTENSRLLFNLQINVNDLQISADR